MRDVAAAPSASYIESGDDQYVLTWSGSFDEDLNLWELSFELWSDDADRSRGEAQVVVFNHFFDDDASFVTDADSHGQDDYEMAEELVRCVPDELSLARDTGRLAYLKMIIIVEELRGGTVARDFLERIRGVCASWLEAAIWIARPEPFQYSAEERTSDVYFAHRAALRGYYTRVFNARPIKRSDMLMLLWADSDAYDLATALSGRKRKANARVRLKA